MLISNKQHEANIHNAQKSTGPSSDDGKQAVRFNALQHGLRARQVLLPKDDPEEFHQLCADLEAEWQPQTCTQRLLLEQMAVSQWILGRLARLETNGFSLTQLGIQDQYAFLDRISALRTRQERSFSKAMRDLEHLQRRPRPEAKPEPEHIPEPLAPQPPRPEPPPFPDPIAYVMSGRDAAAPIHPDTR
jgi:hypothetical protein